MDLAGPGLPELDPVTLVDGRVREGHLVRSHQPRLSRTTDQWPRHLCLDDYHGLDRRERSLIGVTALDPRANNFALMENQLLALKRGNPITKRVYDHSDGTFGPPEENQPKEVVIVQGLHPFLVSGVRGLFDLNVWLDPETGLKHRWKVQRDVAQARLHTRAGPSLSGSARPGRAADRRPLPARKPVDDYAQFTQTCQDSSGTVDACGPKSPDSHRVVWGLTSRPPVPLRASSGFPFARLDLPLRPPSPGFPFVRRSPVVPFGRCPGSGSPVGFPPGSLSLEQSPR